MSLKGVSNRDGVCLVPHRRQSINLLESGQSNGFNHDRTPPSPRSCRIGSPALTGANENTRLEFIGKENMHHPMNMTTRLLPTNQIPRRHSTHSYPSEHLVQMVPSQAPPLPLRPPAVPERSRIGPPPPPPPPPPPISNTQYNSSNIYKNLVQPIHHQQLPHIPPHPKNNHVSFLSKVKKTKIPSPPLTQPTYLQLQKTTQHILNNYAPQQHLQQQEQLPKQKQNYQTGTQHVVDHQKQQQIKHLNHHQQKQFNSSHDTNKYGPEQITQYVRHSPFSHQHQHQQQQQSSVLRHTSPLPVQQSQPIQQIPTPQSHQKQQSYNLTRVQQCFEQQLQQKLQQSSQKLRTQHSFNQQDMIHNQSLRYQPNFDNSNYSRIENIGDNSSSYDDTRTQDSLEQISQYVVSRFQQPQRKIADAVPERTQSSLESSPKQSNRVHKTLEQLAAEIHPSRLTNTQEISSSSQPVRLRRQSLDQVSSLQSLAIQKSNRESTLKTDLSKFPKQYPISRSQHFTNQEPSHSRIQSSHDQEISASQNQLNLYEQAFQAQLDQIKHNREIISQTEPLIFQQPRTQQSCDKALNSLVQSNMDHDSIQNYTPKIEQSMSRPQNEVEQSNSAGNMSQQNSNGNNIISVRQDSNVSSDSFSQNSSPSYTTKTMETPLLPQSSLGSKNSSGQHHKSSTKPVSSLHTDSQKTLGNTERGDGSVNNALTKSISTPASLQTIVRFHHGSNMSLHHRIIRDIRRPSAHYVTRGRLRFRFAQVLLNAIALLAIAGGLAAYFRAYPSTVRYINKTLTSTNVAVASNEDTNPAPGICLPVIVSFCHYHKVPYNYTMFPNYIGHFTQIDAQQELEMYDAVVDVRCYELAALFLCSVFVPKCGPTGQLVRPCRNLCFETKRRCGFFLEVFGLTLPEYLDCGLFPESPEPDVCVGHQEVIEAEVRAQQPVCTKGFACDIRRCIPSDWRCDGHVDCEDQSDELNCEHCDEGMIHCGSNKCMAQSHMCDGLIDCPWGQDERNCLRLSERMGDVGLGELQIFHPDLQNWQPACVTHWDPIASPATICNTLGYSIVNSSALSMRSGNFSMASSDLSPHLRKFHHLKQSSLLMELRSCPGGNYPNVELTCTQYVCGKMRRLTPLRSSTRIVGGVESAPGDWPFLAALLGGPEEVFYCAGVLISDQWVLTASHCVGNFSQSDSSGWTIQLGITRRHAHSYFGQKMKVRRVVPHPMYNLGVAHDNDVALFQLKSRVTFHEHLLPVCLPAPNKELQPGTVCTVIGWGKKEDKDISEYEPAVNEVQVPILRREMCNQWLEEKDLKDLNVTEGMICAGFPEGGKDACQGDSGGPLLCQDTDSNDRWFVGGIVSWGIKCAHPRLPGVYAYVPRYVPWITQQMALYSD